MEWYARMPSDVIGVASDGEPTTAIRVKAQATAHRKDEIMMLFAVTARRGSKSFGGVVLLPVVNPGLIAPLG